MSYEDRVGELVRAAVLLAIVRHDLATDDAPVLSDGDARAIAEDAWNALNGVGSCSAEVAPELAAVAELELIQDLICGKKR